MYFLHYCVLFISLYQDLPLALLSSITMTETVVIVFDLNHFGVDIYSWQGLWLVIPPIIGPWKMITIQYFKGFMAHKSLGSYQIYCVSATDTWWQWFVVKESFLLSESRDAFF